jgi:peroxiredoxin (alkyl hydroperoxide reductase subunit C)
MKIWKQPTMIIVLAVFSACSCLAKNVSLQSSTYNPGTLKPVDSKLKVAVGQLAPDFSLKSIRGGVVRLSQFRGKKNVVLSFVPAAWTPVCSDQWPGYNITKKIFDDHNAVLLGITVDNIPTLFAWTEQMGGLWFDVMSDFWPHGEVAGRYGVLRTDGTAERALIFIDTKGIIRGIHVSDINIRPPLEIVVNELNALE